MVRFNDDEDLRVVMSIMKVEQMIAKFESEQVPKNYRQATESRRFEDYWLPAMKAQDESLI